MKTKHGMQVDEADEPLAEPFQVRLRQADAQILEHLDTIGITKSSVVRKCVSKALADVQAEIVAALTQRPKKP